ncbi:MULTISPECIES: hypothetical protein [Vibrio]|jgi:hypothetical protein|uniref:hypothetical protein n=1 Tax=Vibrio TaxID=662 RepID=UPI00015407F3|nr:MULTISPECIES: hypothetical protein [Vibrio]EDL55262.1 hypothetical protein VSAK1_20059 [Vibrio mediterranei AK1]MCF4172108.1 hypothetical protein [Vibrio sp. McD22-P3]MCG9664113.1 hypothetical protein [Vibrio mediterranei]MCG9789811.1 hypothetical protein [Vibrio mediterranei]MCY9851928.1 hypothetical protein [Vibrio mediterranei]
MLKAIKNALTFNLSETDLDEAIVCIEQAVSEYTNSLMALYEWEENTNEKRLSDSN